MSVDHVLVLLVALDHHAVVLTKGTFGSPQTRTSSEKHVRNTIVTMAQQQLAVIKEQEQAGGSRSRGRVPGKTEADARTELKQRLGGKLNDYVDRSWAAGLVQLYRAEIIGDDPTGRGSVEGRGPSRR